MSEHYGHTPKGQNALDVAMEQAKRLDEELTILRGQFAAVVRERDRLKQVVESIKAQWRTEQPLPKTEDYERGRKQGWLDMARRDKSGDGFASGVDAGMKIAESRFAAAALVVEAERRELDIRRDGESVRPRKYKSAEEWWNAVLKAKADTDAARAAAKPQRIMCPRCMPPGDPCCSYCNGTYEVTAPAAKE